MVVEWIVNERGSAATEVEVEIREFDGITFTTESTYCAPSDAQVLLTMSCEVPFSVLTSLPYHLPYGSSIYARVKVTNA